MWPGKGHPEQFRAPKKRDGRQAWAFVAALALLGLSLLAIVLATPPATSYPMLAAGNAGGESSRNTTSESGEPLSTPAENSVAAVPPTGSPKAQGVLASTKMTPNGQLDQTVNATWNAAQHESAIVLTVKGRVTARLPGNSAATERELGKGDVVPAGWEVVTGPQSDVELGLAGPARIYIGPTSAVVLAPGNPVPNRSGNAVRPALRVNIGIVLVHVLRDVARWAQFSVETPTAVAGVRGTIFDVRVTSGLQTQVSVWEGQVAVQPLNAGALEPEASLVDAGESVTVNAGSDINLDRNPRTTSGKLEVKHEPQQFAQVWAQRQDWLKTQKRWEHDARKKLQSSPKAAEAPPETQPAAGKSAAKAPAQASGWLANWWPFGRNKTEHTPWGQPKSSPPATGKTGNDQGKGPGARQSQHNESEDNQRDKSREQQSGKSQAQSETKQHPEPGPQHRAEDRPNQKDNNSEHDRAGKGRDETPEWRGEGARKYNGEQ